jgi:hypothetical protein
MSLILCKIGIFDLSFLNLTLLQITALNCYVFENYTLISFIFIVHIPSIFFSFLRLFYVLFYFYKLCLLKFNVINNIKSPLYDYFENEVRVGFFNFYRTHIKVSVFNFFHNFLYKNSDSKVDRIKKTLLYAYNNINFFLLMMLLPSKHLIRIVLFYFDIFRNFKKWRHESGAKNSSLVKSISQIVERKSRILF